MKLTAIFICGCPTDRLHRLNSWAFAVWHSVENCCKPVAQQVVAIMGASSGIGRETAPQIAQRGAKVIGAPDIAVATFHGAKASRKASQPQGLSHCLCLYQEADSAWL
ncbi:hypothetical protein H6G89_32235 [Oscillatoria sp. FACHB-1407]|uniref:hypothetical protein n=1 Tax=Oscillatoria sp. FACHB-1407 TaxID=2692847 RepID=UPI00168344DE|nr:hypothetical protein [Oscillatoria sp. FACHB-1407]MBD2465662.1 hypothetical protein [Oscillatoria sp. FACHB-1407]